MTIYKRDKIFMRARYCGALKCLFSYRNFNSDLTLTLLLLSVANIICASFTIPLTSVNKLNCI